MTSYQLEQEESKNRQIAFFITLALYSLMFFLFWYVVIWTAEENKKVEEAGGGGFVVNFGTDKKGSGNVFTKNHASPLKNEVDSKPAEVVEVKKTKKPMLVPEVVKVKPVKPKPVKETPVMTSKVKSPVVVKETPPAKVTPKPSSKPVETPPTPASPKAVEQPKVNSDGLFPAKKGKSNSNGTTGSNPNAGGGNDGNDSKGVGNKGQPDGNSVINGTYEKKPVGTTNTDGPGGKKGPGSALSITGWTWTSRPNVSDDSDETGIIKFRIKVDADGDVVDVTQIESTVSPAVAQQYKRAVQRTKFKPTSDGDKPDISTGTVSFRLSPR